MGEQCIFPSLTGALRDTFGLLFVDIMSHHKQVKAAFSVILRSKTRRTSSLFYLCSSNAGGPLPRSVLWAVCSHAPPRGAMFGATITCSDTKVLFLMTEDAVISPGSTLIIPIMLDDAHLLHRGGNLIIIIDNNCRSFPCGTSFSPDGFLFPPQLNI